MSVASSKLQDALDWLTRGRGESERDFHTRQIQRALAEAFCEALTDASRDACLYWHTELRKTKSGLAVDILPPPKDCHEVSQLLTTMGFQRAAHGTIKGLDIELVPLIQREPLPGTLEMDERHLGSSSKSGKVQISEERYQRIRLKPDWVSHVPEALRKQLVDRTIEKLVVGPMHTLELVAQGTESPLFPPETQTRIVEGARQFIEKVIARQANLGAAR